MTELRDLTHQEIIARLEKLDTFLKIIETYLKILRNENSMIYMLQKEENKFFIILTILVSVGFSLMTFLQQKYYFIIGIIGILLLLATIVYYWNRGRKANKFKKELWESNVKFYKARGFSDEKIKQLLDKDIWMYY